MKIWIEVELATVIELLKVRGGIFSLGLVLSTSGILTIKSATKNDELMILFEIMSNANETKMQETCKYAISKPMNMNNDFYVEIYFNQAGRLSISENNGKLKKIAVFT